MEIVLKQNKTQGNFFPGTIGEGRREGGKRGYFPAARKNPGGGRRHLKSFPVDFQTISGSFRGRAEEEDGFQCCVPPCVVKGLALTGMVGSGDHDVGCEEPGEGISSMLHERKKRKRRWCNGKIRTRASGEELAVKEEPGALGGLQKDGESGLRKSAPYCSQRGWEGGGRRN